MRNSVLIAMLLAAFALFGCTTNSQTGTPSGSDNGLGVPANPGGNIYDTPAAPQGSGQGPQVVPDLPPSVQPQTNGSVAQSPVLPASSRCSITLEKSEIYAGESVGVTAVADMNSGEAASYSCGSKTTEMGSNGFFNRFSICDYSASGVYSVSLFINGVPCATKTLTVLPAKAATVMGKCNLVEGSVKKDMSDMYFEAAVNYSGYAPNTTLKWECGWRNYQKVLGTSAFGSSTADGVIVVSCRYTDYELIPNSIQIFVGDDACGEIQIK